MFEHELSTNCFINQKRLISVEVHSSDFQLLIDQSSYPLTDFLTFISLFQSILSQLSPFFCFFFSSSTFLFPFSIFLFLPSVLGLDLPFLFLYFLLQFCSSVLLFKFDVDFGLCFGFRLLFVIGSFLMLNCLIYSVDVYLLS